MMRPKIAGIRAKDRQTFNRQVNAYLKKLRAQASEGAPSRTGIWR